MAGTGPVRIDMGVRTHITAVVIITANIIMVIITVASATDIDKNIKCQGETLTLGEGVDYSKSTPFLLVYKDVPTMGVIVPKGRPICMQP